MSLSLPPRLAIVLVTLFGPFLSGAIAAPPAIVERDSRREWIESNAWGGGVRYVFGEPEKGATVSLQIPGGAAFEFVFGCQDSNPATSYWRFRVGATPAGSGVTEASEIAYDKALKRLFGVPGTMVLLDDRNRETRRIALSPRNDGLETGALREDEVQAVLNASAIRAEGPGFLLETGTFQLGATLQKQRKLRCVRR